MALSPPSLALLFQTRECCAGYFGPQCQPCPGKAENVCFGNGICLDGVNGTGACECGRGFSGTACETCAEGKYGIHCDQGAHPATAQRAPQTSRECRRKESLNTCSLTSLCPGQAGTLPTPPPAISM